MYKAAVIGLGNIGFQFNLDPKRKETWSHVSAYNKCKKTTLVGAVEIDEDKITIFKKHHNNIPVYKKISELMKNLRPDVISICTPDKTHFLIAKEILQYPIKAIFCEKPITPTIEEGKELIKLCSQKGVILAVNHIRRWDSNYLFVKELIRNNLIGSIRIVNGIYSGQIFNIGSHLIDVIRMLLQNNISIVSGICDNLEAIDPDISGWIKFENGIIGSILSTGKRNDLIFDIDIIGEEGRVKILDNGERIEIYSFQQSSRYSGYRELKIERHESIKKTNRFIDAIEDIISVIEEKKKRVNCSGEDALFSLIVCYGLVESSKNKGIPIKLNEII